MNSRNDVINVKGRKPILVGGGSIHIDRRLAALQALAYLRP
jgi:hypothetical protein